MPELDYEARLKLQAHDFVVSDGFDFKYTPVGFRFFNVASDLEGLGLEQLDSNIAWCQMLSEAQKGRAFYATAENHYCEPGIFLSGHGELSALAAGGRIGPPFDISPDERPIVVIPWHHIDRVLRNISEMPWSLPGHTNKKEEAYQKGFERLGVEGII